MVREKGAGIKMNKREYTQYVSTLANEFHSLTEDEREVLLSECRSRYLDKQTSGSSDSFDDNGPGAHHDRIHATVVSEMGDRTSVLDDEHFK